MSETKKSKTKQIKLTTLETRKSKTKKILLCQRSKNLKQKLSGSLCQTSENIFKKNKIWITTSDTRLTPNHSKGQWYEICKEIIRKKRVSA